MRIDELLVVSNHPHISLAEVDGITEARWYEHKESGLILVPMGDLPPEMRLETLCLSEPEDCGIEDLQWEDTDYIPDSLKRWNPADGFYHA